MLRHLLQMPWHLAYQFAGWRLITRGSAASWDVFLIPKISYIIRHCKFVSQGACIFPKKKTQNDMSNWNKKPDDEKIYRWTEFFTSWTITSEKYTRAYVQENKSIYLSIYLSVWKPFWKRVYIYIYILFCSFYSFPFLAELLAREARANGAP